MKSGLIFWSLQLKKYKNRLPLILLESILFGALLLIFGCCAAKMIYGEKSISPISIGVVSEEESKTTELLVQFVASMDSVQENYNFVLMEELQAKEALQKGELYAAVVLPEGVLESILSGENQPAQILLGTTHSRMETEVFEALARAANRLISTAQVGIYAADGLCSAAGYTELIDETEELLNRAYLSYALERNSVFKMHEVQATGKLGLAAYYSMALFLVFMSFAGMILGKYIMAEKTALSCILRAKRLGCFRQALAESGAFALVFALFGMLPGIPMLLGAMAAEKRGMPEAVGILLLFLVLFSLGAFIRLLLALTGKEPGGIGIGMGLLLMMMTASGLLLPTAFLPVFVEKAGQKLPYCGWLKVLLAVVEKEASGAMALLSFGAAMLCLLASAGIFCLKGQMFFQETRTPSVWRSRRKKENRRAGAPARMQLFAVLTKQYLIKYRVWFVVLFVMAVSFGIWGVRTEKSALAGIPVGIYCEDDNGMRLYEQLKKEESIFQVQLYEEKEEMLRLLENGTLECAYAFPKGFFENMAKQRTNRQIDLYYAPNSSAYKLSYEVVFSHLYSMLSEEILDSWLEESSLPLDREQAKKELDVFKKKYEEQNSTFTFEYKRVHVQKEESQAYEKITLNPVRGFIAVLLFFMSLLGLGNCCELWGMRKVFSKKTAEMIKGSSLLIAVLFTVLSGLMLLVITGSFDRAQAGKELLALLLYGAGLLLYLGAASKILRTADRVYGMIPILLLGSLLLCPVFIRAETYVPIVGLLKYLFPPTWYLQMFL